MTEEQKTVAEMLRTTTTNSLEFLNHVADHIEKLEEYVKLLEQQVVDLGGEIPSKQ